MDNVRTNESDEVLKDKMKGHMKICSENQVINKEGVSKRGIFINLSMPFMAYLKYHLITI